MKQITTQSIFPRMLFNPEDVGLRKGIKSDPLMEGVDYNDAVKAEEAYNYLIERRKLPNTFDIHNPMELLPGKKFDTTNKNIERWSKDGHFDTEGYKNGIPLQKDIYYFNPYITCTNCNLVNFIDGMNLRYKINLDDELKSIIPNEMIPPCKKCLRTDCYIVGIMVAN